MALIHPDKETIKTTNCQHHDKNNITILSFNLHATPESGKKIRQENQTDLR